MGVRCLYVLWAQGRRPGDLLRTQPDVLVSVKDGNQ
jgi:hypothetical protein